MVDFFIAVIVVLTGTASTSIRPDLLRPPALNNDGSDMNGRRAERRSQHCVTCQEKAAWRWLADLPVPVILPRYLSGCMCPILVSLIDNQSWVRLRHETRWIRQR